MECVPCSQPPFPANSLRECAHNLAPAPLVKTFSCSAIGNMLSKSDVGNYAYAPPGSPLPHAVISTSGGALSTTFTYDPNGNQTSGLGRLITYTSYNKPASITQGTRTVSFQDDTEHQRFKQVTPDGTTLYIVAFGVLAEISDPGTTAAKWTEYLSVGNAKVGMRTLQVVSQTLTTRYFHTDHLGSVSVITNENGVVVERLSYDAWGKRRNPDGSDDTAGSLTSQTTRGFTGEEQLSVAGLVHLNGRVYDPILARFTSADPITESPFSTQGWNRYSYVGNDPLAFTDPSGFCFLGCFWQHIGKAISSGFRAVGNFIKENARAILQIAATVVLNAVLPGLGFAGLGLAVAAGAGGAMIATGLTGGNLGQVLKAGLIAGATAFAFYGVGEFTNQFAGANPGPGGAHGTPSFLSEAHLVNIGGHAAVGCASSVASGGECGPGALSGAVGSFGGPLMKGMNGAQKLVAHTILGGVGSVAGGGKFANGAVTGAFGYLFNHDAIQEAVSSIGSMFSISPAAAMSLSAQQDANSKYKEVSGDVTFVGGGQVEITSRIGAQLSGGVFVTVEPINMGLFGSFGWMVGLNGGASIFGGGLIGGSDTLRGTAGTGGISSPFGGVSTTVNPNREITGVYWSSPAPKAGASVGLSNTCIISFRGAGC